MPAPLPLNYATPSHCPAHRRGGYLALAVLNGLALVLAGFMAVCGATSAADGWGGLGMALGDLLLSAAQVLLLISTIIYAAVQSRRHPSPTGHPLTWLVLESVFALLLCAAAILVFNYVPHKPAC